MKRSDTTRPLIHENFLLKNRYAEILYHEYARNMPIIDYHNHLSPKTLAENTIFKNITQLWIEGDHYKWRAMRGLGIDEKYITGKASDDEKFMKWAYCVPYIMRNPLYHWTHLELARYFDTYELLSEKSASEILSELSGKVNSPQFSAQRLISQMNVEVLCTTEDPTDTLEHHKKLAESEFKTKVSTSFRPDKALSILAPAYNEYLEQLGEVSNVNIESYNDLCKALESRLSYFHQHGCRLSDHGLPYMYAVEFTDSEVDATFQRKLNGLDIASDEALKFQSALLIFLCRKYHELGWVQQFHLGPIRNNNSRMFTTLGSDTGWDSIGDFPQALPLAKFLGKLDADNRLTKTIIYNINPSDNAVLATMIGNFNDGSMKGKIQWGSGWWFLDQKDGIINQLNDISSMGLISTFVGMLTDSRSFLSFPRHEYFRRILCNVFAQDIENGDLPEDLNWIGKLVQDICYNNAKDYFNFTA